MAKYDAKKRGTKVARHGCGFFKHLGLVCVSFVVGYGCGSYYDYTKLSAWIATHGVAMPPTPAIKPIEEARLPKPKFEFYTLLTQDSRTNKLATNTAPASAPSTTMSMTVPVGSRTGVAPNSASSTAVTSANIPPQPANVASTRLEPAIAEARALPAQSSARSLPALASNKDAYLVQLASFRRQIDADRLKASLTMKGFHVNVVAVMQQGMSWYRVVLGPFDSRLDALRAQSNVARSERIVGMIRKMDA